MDYRCVIANGSTLVIACGYATDQPGQCAGDDYHGIGVWSMYTHATLPDVPEGHEIHEIDGELVVTEIEPAE